MLDTRNGLIYTLHMENMIRYTLPGGAVILVPRDVCRAASTISFTMQDGRIVDAIIVRGEQ